MKTIFSVLSLVGMIILVSCGLNDPNDPSPAFAEQLAIDIELIDAYLLENEIVAETHESGIQYAHNVIGDGPSPEMGDLVVIKFNGMFFDGTNFGEDSIGFTLKLSDPTLVVLQVIIPLMNVGGSTTMYSPSGYCFGKNGAIGVPANSNLIFEIELLAIIKNAEDQLIADENIINEYLAESDLTAETHSSGIRFITLVEGTGNSPISTDQIFVKYKGTFLGGQVFDQSTVGIQFPLSNFIESWKIMIPTMKEGGKLQIYSPSRYCYGTTGSGSIPPNTILAFEIELISIN
jgi:FKBP-type peptidyl-prolyl cis-trans isomerase FkpA